MAVRVDRKQTPSKASQQVAHGSGPGSERVDTQMPPVGPPVPALRGVIGNAAFARLVQAAAREQGVAMHGPPGALLQRDDAPATPQQAVQPQNTPAQPQSGQQQPAETYTLTLSDGQHPNLSQQDAIALLTGAEQSLHRALDRRSSGEWAEVNKSRTTFWGALGGTLVDLAGKNFPNYDESWGPAENAMIAVRHALTAHDVKAAGDQLQTANAAYEKGKAQWIAYKNQLDDAGTKAYEEIAVTAVVAVAVIATGGLVAEAVVPAAGVGGGVVVGGGVATEAALATTVPVAVTATEGAAAVGTVTEVGVGGATADAIVNAAFQDATTAFMTAGAEAATATAEGMSVSVLEGVIARLTIICGANYPFTTVEAQAFRQLLDVLPVVWKGKAGF